MSRFISLSSQHIFTDNNFI